MQIKNIILYGFLGLLVLFLINCENQPTSFTKNAQLLIRVSFDGNNESHIFKKFDSSKFNNVEIPNKKKDSLNFSTKDEYYYIPLKESDQICLSSFKKVIKTIGNSLTNSTIKFTGIFVQIFETDGSEIFQQQLIEQPDGSFQGDCTIIAGKGRIIEVMALYNSDIIAVGEAANVDILPGRCTVVSIILSWIAGFERNLEIVSSDTMEGIINTYIQEPINARVTDFYHIGVHGIMVFYKVIKGDVFLIDPITQQQHLDSLNILTDSTGLTSALFYLGSIPGENQVKVESKDISGDQLIGSPRIIIINSLSQFK